MRTLHDEVRRGGAAQVGATGLPHTLSAGERDRYAAEIGFIRHRFDCAERRFQRIRDAQVVLLGGGPVLDELLAAGLRSGWSAVQVLCTDGADAVALLDKSVTRLRQDPAQEVLVQALPGIPDDPDQLAPRLADAELVLQVGDDPAPLLAVCRVAERTGTALGQVLLAGGEAWVSGVGPARATAAASCWHRLAGLRGAAGADPCEPDWLTGPAPAVVATRLVLNSFWHLARMDAPDRAAQRPTYRVTRVDLRTLDAHAHRFAPHPSAAPAPPRTRAAVRARLDALAAGRPVPAEDLLARADRCVDTRLGLLGALDDEGLAQVPLWACHAVVSDPHGLLPGWPPPKVVGWGTDRQAARVRTVLAALATYAALAAGRPDDTDSAWARELATGRMRAVPAGLAHPTPAGSAYRVPVGVAAGLSFAEAVSAGLAAHCEALLAARDVTVYPTLDPAAAAGGEAGHLLHLLDVVGETVVIHDLTAAFDLPALAFVAGGAPVAVSCAASPALAVRQGLERTLLAWQARTEQQPAYTAAVPRWSTESSPGVAALVHVLRRAGHTPAVLPLDHDEHAAAVLPFVVRVVLCDD